MRNTKEQNDVSHNGVFFIAQPAGLLPCTISIATSPQGLEFSMRIPLLLLAVLSAVSVAAAQSVPAAIYTDPPVDAAHPAAMVVLHIPSHGAMINGVVYSPAGAGSHPTLVICHGLPGNEKNLDLAQ